jgi:hypothetical protein
MDVDALLAALSLSIAVGGLVPIFIIKENRRKELTIAVVVSMLIALTAITEGRRQEHAAQVRAIEHEIVAKLSGHRWTQDELHRQLHYPRRDVFFEALFAAVELHRVEQAVSPVRIDDGLPVDVRLYWVEAGRPTDVTSVVPDASGPR